MAFLVITCSNRDSNLVGAYDLDWFHPVPAYSGSEDWTGRSGARVPGPYLGVMESWTGYHDHRDPVDRDPRVQRPEIQKGEARMHLE